MFCLHQNSDHIDLFMVKLMVLVFSLSPFLEELELDKDDRIHLLELGDTEFDNFAIMESIKWDLELEEDSIDMDMLDELKEVIQLIQLFALQFL